jgi:Ni/Co efflux regulator RcnB
MKLPQWSPTRRAVLAAVILTLCVPVTFADKPDKADKDKHKKHDEDRRDGDERRDDRDGFGPHERDLVRDYFLHTHGRGNCPPGLAKKNNGCLPPGQAKKRYLVGRPLPATVVVREVPRDIAVRLGPPPRGYRYGVVDGDVVKLAVGTALVVDAIEALVR